MGSPHKRALPPFTGDASASLTHSTTIALDRDASVQLELRFQPPTANVRPTEWLLLHAIPVTAGLATVLKRLQEAQQSAAESMPETPSPAASSPPPAGSSAEGSVAERRGCTTPSTVAAPVVTSAAGPSLRRIEFLRVGYVLSEIHSYCLLLHCTSAEYAAALKATLQRGAALGAATPAEYVLADAVHVTCREETAPNDGTAQSVHELPLPQAVLFGVSRAGWRCGSHPPTCPQTPSRRVKMPEGQRVARGYATPLLDGPSAANASFGSAPASAPLPPLTLPSAPHTPLLVGLSDESCAICQVEPLATQPCAVTLCRHVFHLSCYAQLTSAECPLCRFSLYSLLSDAHCAECGTYEDLWVCLVCGHVGCGRGRRNHQRAHAEETGHSCAVQSSTSRIWNERTRMFVNQEVALLLGEFDGDREVDKGVGQGEHGTLSLWTMSIAEVEAMADARDEALSSALTESKEEAVHGFYVGTLRALLEEQKTWYAARTQALVAALKDAAVERRRRDPQTQKSVRGSSPAAAAEDDTPAEQSAARELESLVQEEMTERRAIATSYAEDVRLTVSLMTQSLRAIVRRQRTVQEDLQETALMQSHRNVGLQSTIARLRQRIVEAEAKGAADVKAKEERRQQLESRVSAALDSLTS